MKNQIVILFLSLFPIITFGQDYKTELNEEGKFVMEIIKELPEKSASDLFNRSKEWVAYNWKNTNAVSQSEIENKMVRISGVSQGVIIQRYKKMVYTSGLGYNIQIDIKENKIRFRAYQMYYVDAESNFINSMESTLLKSNIEMKTNKVLDNVKPDTDKELSRIFQSLIDSFEKEIETDDDW